MKKEEFSSIFSFMGAGASEIAPYIGVTKRWVNYARAHDDWGRVEYRVAFRELEEVMLGAVREARECFRGDVAFQSAVSGDASGVVVMVEYPFSAEEQDESVLPLGCWQQLAAYVRAGLRLAYPDIRVEMVPPGASAEDGVEVGEGRAVTSVFSFRFNGLTPELG